MGLHVHWPPLSGVGECGLDFFKHDKSEAGNVADFLFSRRPDCKKMQKALTQSLL